jgi:hypothetical protein
MWSSQMLRACQLSFAGASPTRHGVYDLYLFAVLFDQVADVDDAIGAGVGAISILSGWVRWVCGRLLCGHEVPLRGPCLREIRPSAEASYVVNNRIIPCAY